MNIWESREKEERAISLVKEFIELLGEDPNREGLKDTPKRCVNMIKEVLEVVRYTNEEIAKMANRVIRMKGGVVAEVIVNRHPASAKELVW